MDVCVCVYIHVHTHVRMDVCVCVHSCAYVCTCGCVCVCTFMCIRMYMWMCVCVCTFMCIWMCVCVYVHVHTYVHTDACVCVPHMELLDAVSLVVEEGLGSLNGHLPLLCLVLGLRHVHLDTLRLQWTQSNQTSYAAITHHKVIFNKSTIAISQSKGLNSFTQEPTTDQIGYGQVSTI